MAELEWHDFSLKKQTKLKTNLKIISKSSIVSPTLKNNMIRVLTVYNRKEWQQLFWDENVNGLDEHIKSF